MNVCLFWGREVDVKHCDGVLHDRSKLKHMHTFAQTRKSTF